MKDDKQFTEEQKQYLAGFSFGADVARAVSGLPIISGSAAAANGTSISLGAERSES